MVVGREVELNSLVRALHEARPVLLTGEPGVGKTALARAAVARAGLDLREGGAFSVLTWMAYLPLRRAVGLELPTTADAAAVSDALSVTVQVEERLGSAALLLDDLQWADTGTVRVATLLADRAPLVAVVRSGPGSDEVRASLLDAGFTELAVPPLGEDAVATMVRARRPGAGPLTVARLARSSGGNPLILGELLDAPDSEVPESLRLALAARVRALAVDARTAFEMLALAEQPLPAAAVGGTAAHQLLSAGLVVDTGDGITVRHALIGAEAVATLARDRVSAHHRRLAGLLADEPGTAAIHLLAAGELEDAHRAALRAAAATPHPVEAARHLAVAARSSGAADAADLRLRAAAGLATAGEMEQVLEVLGDQVPDRPDQAAAWHLMRSRALWHVGDDDGFVAQLHAGLALAGSASPAVSLRLRIDALREPLFLTGSVVDAATVRQARDLVDEARQLGAEETRARFMLGTVLYQADVEGWEEELEQARLLGRATDPEAELLAANNLVTAHESSGDPQRGRALALEMRARCRDLHARAWEQQFAALLLNLQMHAGELHEAVSGGLDLLGEPLEMRTRQQLEATVVMSLVSLGRLDLARGHLDAMAARGSTEDFHGRGNLRYLEAELELAAGRPAQALERVTEAMAYMSPAIQGIARPAEAWARYELSLEVPSPSEPAEGPSYWDACVREARAVALLAAEDFDAAVDALEAVAGSYARLHRRGELRCRYAIARALRLRGDVDAAREELLAVERAAADHGMVSVVDRVRRELRLAGVRRAAPRHTGRAGGLTAREHELLTLVGHGLTDVEIARRLALSTATVRTTLRSAIARLGAGSRGQAVVAAGAGVPVAAR